MLAIVVCSCWCVLSFVDVCCWCVGCSRGCCRLCVAGGMRCLSCVAFVCGCCCCFGSLLLLYVDVCRTVSADGCVLSLFVVCVEVVVVRCCSRCCRWCVLLSLVCIACCCVL